MSELKRQGIPENAKLAFKGVIFEVWQWEQEMFDGSIEIFERIWRPSTVTVIATVDNKIIIEDQDQPNRKNFLSLAGGRADSEDDMLAEAKRELLEETGRESDDWELLFEKTPRSTSVLWHEYFFIARNCKEVRKQELDAGEKIELRFISFEELLELADEPRFRISTDFIFFLKELRDDESKREAFRKKIFNT